MCFNKILTNLQAYLFLIINKTWKNNKKLISINIIIEKDPFIYFFYNSVNKSFCTCISLRANFRKLDIKKKHLIIEILMFSYQKKQQLKNKSMQCN